MYVIKENSRFTSNIRTLDHTAAETAEKCFWGFIDHTREMTYQEAEAYWLEWLDDMEKTAEEMPIEEFYSCKKKDLQKPRLFEASNGSESMIFGFDKEPSVGDWNEILQYVFGTVTSPRAAEAKYFIDKISA